MEGLGFPSHFVALILTCLSTATFSINVNGKRRVFSLGKEG